MIEWVEYGYLGLFIVSFLAATVIPLSSDVVLGTMLLGDFNVLILFISASLGNWLGGMTSYYIGYLGKWKWIEKYFRVSRSKIESMNNNIQKYGSILAFFTWVPIIGDPVAIALGFFRTNVVATFFWMLIGKTLRYLVIILLVKSTL